MTMPHITAQMRPKMLMHNEGRARISKMMAGIPDSIGDADSCTHEQQQNSLTVAGASSPSTILNQSPCKRKFNVLLTPTLVTSAVFDTPLKQSPSSSLSSADDSQSFAVVKRGPTPIAELEDTSRASIFCSELEDTSGLAMSSHNRKITSPKWQSSHPSSRALVAAVDRQFADYEEEIRQLRRDFVRKEQLTIAAQKATAEAQDALLTAKKTVAEQEAVIEQLFRLNVKLEQEVIHCKKHHLPPPTPSKSKDFEIPISLFNPDTNRASTSAVTPRSPPISAFPSSGNLFANSPRNSPKTLLSSAHKHSSSTQVANSIAVGSRRSGVRQTNEKSFSPSSNNSSPKSVAAAASPVAKSPSAGGNPYARPPNPTYNATPPKLYVPLTADTLSAVASSSPRPKSGANSSETHHFTPLGFVPSSESIKSNTINESESQRPKSKKGRPGHLRSHSSTLSLYLRGPLSPYNYSTCPEPMPSMMSGGLVAPFSPTTENIQVVDQEHTLRKKLGEFGSGLSDLFRTKE